MTRKLKTSNPTAAEPTSGTSVTSGTITNAASANLESLLHDPNDHYHQKALRLIRRGHVNDATTFGDLDRLMAVDDLEQAILRHIEAWFSHYDSLDFHTVSEQNTALSLILLHLALAPDEFIEEECLEAA